MQISSKKKIVLLCSLGSMILLWQIVTWITGNRYLMPCPAETGIELLRLFTTPGFLKTIGLTLIRGLAGMITATAISLIIAWPASKSQLFFLFLHPPLAILRSVPVISFILLFLIWLKPEHIPFIMALITMIPIMIENLTAGLKRISKQELEMACTFRLSRRTTWEQIIYPALKPYLFSGLLAATGLGWKAIIIGEALAQPQYGIGTAIRQAQSFIEIPLLIAWTVIAIVVGFLFEYLLRWAANKQIRLRFPSNTVSTGHILSKGIHLADLGKSYGNRIVLEHYNQTFKPGITLLTGASGRGKTTLLRLIAGLESPTCGQIEYDRHTHISFLFQEPRLLSHLTVMQNVMLPLCRSHSEYDARTIASRILADFQMESFSGSYPYTLSGGEKQRVALARAWAYPADIRLLDEPFNGLDRRLKQKLLLHLQALQQQEHSTVIYVSHQADEQTIADEITEL